MSITALFRSRLLRNTGWNLLGEGAPLAAALISIPVLIHAIGVERFGALTLTWALLGYLSLLDFGLARALIQRIAGLAGAGRMDEVARAVWPPLIIMGSVGAVAGAALWLTADWLADGVIHASGQVEGEIAGALRMAAPIVPVALVSGGFRGILEGLNRFDLANAVKTPVGVLNYLSPLAVLPFTDSLVAVVAAVAVGRIAGLLAFAALAARTVPGLSRSFGWHSENLRHFLVMGGWISVSNVVGPAMLYVDRFILASLVPMAAVAYYTTPFEVVTRLLFIPAALAGALYPAAAAADRTEPHRLGALVETGGLAVAAVFLPVLVAAFLAGPPVLRVWLGPAFEAEGGPVLCVLALGVFLNAVAYVPFAVIQGLGRADLTAKMHLCELPLYIGVLYALVGQWGIQGAAIAWTLRTGGDLLVILVLAARLTGRVGPSLHLAAVVGSVSLVCVAALLLGGTVGAVVLCVGLAAVGVTAGLHLLYGRLARRSLAAGRGAA